MDPQRLKFAWARGARIQARFDWIDESWHEQITINPEMSGLVWRIHPDDEHLQYGPLSSTLHELVDKPDDIDQSSYYRTAIVAAAMMYAQETDSSYSETHDLDEWGMWCLFFAELLADEGL